MHIFYAVWDCITNFTKASELGIFYQNEILTRKSSIAVVQLSVKEIPTNAGYGRIYSEVDGI